MVQQAAHQIVAYAAAAAGTAFTLSSGLVHGEWLMQSRGVGSSCYMQGRVLVCRVPWSTSNRAHFMSSNLIILGDCNAWMFHPSCDRIRANLHVGPITMSAFCRDDAKFYRDSVFALNSVDTLDATLVLSVGKIDLKSQFWRDIPLLVSRGMPMKEYVQQRIEIYLAQIERFIAHYRLRRVILWGAPGTILNDVPHNDVYPTLGNIPTRNALIHIFNVEFIGAIEAGHPRIGFATLFYHMITSGFDTTPDWMPDGMHVPEAHKPICMSLLDTVLSEAKQSATGEYFNQIKDTQFNIAEAPASFKPGAITNSYFLNWLRVPDAGQIVWAEKPFAMRSYREVAPDATELILAPM